MADPPPDIPLPTGTRPEDRLESWKEIAAYLKRDVTTVQRWEKREAMPVHRHLHDKLGSVYAFRRELDAWAGSRNPSDPAATSESHSIIGHPEAAHDDRPAQAGPIDSSSRRRAAVLAVAAVVTMLVIAGLAWSVASSEYSWRDPLSGADYQTITDFTGSDLGATISRDGRLIAFLSDRSGHPDVWVTHEGSGQFYNLTSGRVPELVNPSIRMLSFSPDGQLVTFWARGAGTSASGQIGVWGVPVLGGEPRPYLDGAAEIDWSGDASTLVYHTPGPGDPMFLRDGLAGREQPIYAAAPGLHAHFPTWSPDRAYIYFVQGSLPDAMDVWRIRPDGTGAERITAHAARVSHPVLIDKRTLLYLVSKGDGSGPSLYGMDVERRVPHQLGDVLQRYTSLAATPDGRHLVATRANDRGSLWRLRMATSPADGSTAVPISLTTARGFSPRLGRGYLLYVASKGSSDGIWRLTGGMATELWSSAGSRVFGGPDISADGRRVTFSVERGGRALLYVMNDDGTQARVVTDALALQGHPAWSPDGESITSAVMVSGKPQLFRISLAGVAVALATEYSMDPVWSPDGDVVAYSGADIGTTFPVKMMSATGQPRAMAPLTLTRGARRMRFMHGRHVLAVLRGQIDHKDLWLVDLDSGTERQLTKLPADFSVRDFDISPDGDELVIERVQDDSDVVRIDLAPPP